MAERDQRPESKADEKQRDTNLFDDESATFPIDPSRLKVLARDPLFLRSVVAVVASLALILLPRSNTFLATVFGVTLIAMGLSSLLGLSRLNSSVWNSSITVGFEVIAGIGLLLGREGSPTTVGRIVALFIGALGLQALIRALNKQPVALHRHSRSWQVVQSLALVAMAALIIQFPETVVWWTIEVFLAGWALVGFISASVKLTPELNDRVEKRLAKNDGAHRIRITMETWLEARPRTAKRRRALYESVFFENEKARSRLVRFWVLMIFASIIGSMGVLTDSTAVVIGAMLIAPLMTPLMAMSIALVMGWEHRLRNAALTALSGILLAITVGMLLGFAFSDVINIETNSQILARTSPTTLDLVIALAAGAAGAYGLGRPDVADSLPGVAIAISLVPPLCVVGICWSQTAFAVGLGALLLFATNMLAILVMGGITFTLIGMTPVREMRSNAEVVRTWVAGIALFGSIVVAGLLINDRSVATDAVARYNLNSTVEDWIAPYPQFRIVDTSISQNKVSAIVAGPDDGALPQAGVLAELLADKSSTDLEVTVRILTENVSTLSTNLGNGG